MLQSKSSLNVDGMNPSVRFVLNSSNSQNQVYRRQKIGQKGIVSRPSTAKGNCMLIKCIIMVMDIKECCNNNLNYIQNM